MGDLASLDELLAKTMKNTKFEGFGPDMTMALPCPFCAEPGFIVGPVAAVEEALVAGGRCAGCGRGAKMVPGVAPGTPNSVTAGGKSFEIMQTVGPEPPVWLVPKIRRVAAQ